MHKTLTLLTSALVMLLAGCAQYEWHKDGAGQIDFDRDVYECQTEAAKLFPAQFVTYSVGSHSQGPSTTNCFGAGSSITCSTDHGIQRPPSSYSVDANAENRYDALKQCIHARGWKRIEVGTSLRAPNTNDGRAFSGNMACGTDSDCPVGLSCRSKKGGGTECRPGQEQGLRPENVACGIDSDCPSGFSCRSKKGGGTECRTTN